MRVLLTCIVALCFMGCADTHQLVRAGNNAKPANLERGASVYIGVPQDGRYGKTLYAGSGPMAAQVIASAFAPYFGKIVVGQNSEELEQATRSARAGNFTYLIFPQILQWEDRATEWSGKPDLVSVKVSVMSAQTGEVLDAAMITGRSGLATLGGDHPQDLLPKPMSEYATSIFK